VNTEKPDLLIIDDKFPGLYTSPTLLSLIEAKETTVILIKRTNGVKEIKEVKGNKDGIEEITISEQQLLDRIRHSSIHKTRYKKPLQKAH
jgi:hypothetical protein